jgi:hypothetical protein
VTSLKELCVGVWWKECGSQGALLDAEDRNRESILEVALRHVTLGVFHKKNEISGVFFFFFFFFFTFKFLYKFKNM